MGGSSILTLLSIELTRVRATRVNGLIPPDPKFQHFSTLLSLVLLLYSPSVSLKSEFTRIRRKMSFRSSMNAVTLLLFFLFVSALGM